MTNPTPRPSRGGLLLFAALMAGICFALLEIGTRAVLALRVGPSVFFYGFIDQRQDENVGRHENISVGYAKYFPNQVRYDTDTETQERYAVHINAQGFRGADFNVEKRPGVARVVTLGASSTFGYHDRDDETYPHYLEQRLNERCAGAPPFEVINLGIPHLTSEQILALYTAEALPLDPDFVTFYEGINDAAAMRPGGAMPPRALSLYQRVSLFAREHLLVLELVREFLAKKRFSEPEVRVHARRPHTAFFANLTRILEASRKRGVRFVVASQQARSGLVPDKEISSVTYAEEVDRVRAKLARDGGLTAAEMFLLTHSGLMADLHAWASANGVPFVDGIGALDRDRDQLATWVHLKPRGNRLLAEALAGAILAQGCPKAAN
jgi:lysophospholipase L1-like esterase